MIKKSLHFLYLTAVAVIVLFTAQPARCQNDTFVVPQSTKRCAKEPVCPMLVPDTISACSGGSVRMSAKATSDDYFIEWESADGSTEPPITVGDSVEFIVDDLPTTFWVRQVDKATGQRSDSVVCVVYPFGLAPVQRTLYLSPGQRRTVSVADQSDQGVLYRWFFDNPVFASVEGDNMQPSITVVANYVNLPLPQTVMLRLERRSCHGQTFHSVAVVIDTFTLLSADGDGLVRKGQTPSGSTDAVSLADVNFEIHHNCGDRVFVHDATSYPTPHAKATKTIKLYNDSHKLVNSITAATASVDNTIYTDGLVDGMTYTVDLVYNGSTTSKAFTFHAAPVITSFSAPQYLCENTPVLFSATAPGDNLVYKWDFGDGSHNFGPSIWHTYSDIAIGNIRYVLLTVTDDNGCVSTRAQRAIVSSNKFDLYELERSPRSRQRPGTPVYIV